MTTLGPIGLASSYPYTDDAAAVADEAQRVESLGFSTLWRSGNLPMLDAAVRATARIPVATGIIPVDSVPAADVIATYRSLQRDHPGRFVVGLGCARSPRRQDARGAGHGGADNRPRGRATGGGRAAGFPDEGWRLSAKPVAARVF
jgi:alkanesulfonate monooxygenase SsuD/methylene tetrahydromethanopterin reductase-like flavin-dependent oxidoreductase (luciferase family)